MAYALYLVPLSSLKATPEPGNHSSTQGPVRIDNLVQNSTTARFFHVKAKAEKSNESIKPNSMVCSDCEGNGAILCSQCKGSGVNSADLFNGQFKAGDSCWLCGISLQWKKGDVVRKLQRSWVSWRIYEHF
ncbi:hypothetical protein PRUPE_1G480000 [Prunus persica]|uniref:BSD2 cysteine rich domain-containing protein n=1 Tax=Prunus persica TaxID=3760 RepID=A0A251RED1_PRUPE|nr:hypothetical protein PRUPE_1G480000 [Prunus persica]